MFFSIACLITFDDIVFAQLQETSPICLVIDTQGLKRVIVTSNVKYLVN
jgi:hypothetical protein